MKPVSVVVGASPLILSQPHSGVFVPEEISIKLNECGRQLRDTDWHVPALYKELVSDVTIVRANFSRYVVDANRDPSGQSLYPGQYTTGLVPTTTFDGEPIWHDPPTDADIEQRRIAFHQPFHDQLRAEIDRVKQQHGYAILFDCHSIRSVVPHLFDGQLPDLNIGTNGGTSCARSISGAVENICNDHDAYRSVLDGRFKGGWITRHYGEPSSNVHAVQMEIAQRCYLKSELAPFAFDQKKAENLRAVLKQILCRLQEIKIA